MKTICIVGAGSAGLLVLQNLKTNGISPSQVILVDPNLCGGDLSLKWSHVRSNTVWAQLLQAVPWEGSLPPQFASLNPDEPCDLRHSIEYLQELTKEYRSGCEVHCTYATAVRWENSKWCIALKTKETVKADVLVLATGSEPKSLDLPYPSIPLPIALDKERLQPYVKKGSHFLVFGTAHSASLIVKNLVDCGSTVTNFYATSKPFYFDRDGEYDGVKQDAARIADQILSGELPVKLVSIQDTASVIRHTKRVDGVVYAIGFEPRNPLGLKDYNGETGQLDGYETAWGFGIAYPNKAPDGIHYDVSIHAFQAHIQRQMPSILSLLRVE